MARQLRDPGCYRALGDRLLARGCVQRAAKAYARWADGCLAERYLAQAQSLVADEPLAALAALSRVDELVGALDEARRLAARAYEALGEAEVAARFRVATR